MAPKDQPVVVEQVLIWPTDYAEPMRLRTLMLPNGASGTWISAGDDELLFVLEGAVEFESAHAGKQALSSGSAAYVENGLEWKLRADQASTVFVFSIPAPVTPWGAALARETGDSVATASLGAQESEVASSDRMFEVLFDASRGCRGATMFVGFIPTSGAPEHYHLYDELCVIVRGSGTLHSAGREQPLSIGSAFHVAPRLLHALENPNAEDLWVLGVFRPEGSAAAAFYPDGRPAPTNEHGGSE